MRNTVRAVAAVEAAKGVLVLLAGLGALSLMHRDVQQLAENLISHLHLNPAKHTPRIFLDASAHLTHARLYWLAAFALAYAALRFIEAYGLWRERRWAAWLAAVSGAIYIPFELAELSSGITALAMLALAVNVVVVGLMSATLVRAGPDHSIKQDPDRRL